MSVDVDEVFPLLLAEEAPVVAIAGNRFFPNQVPAAEDLPAVIWRLVSGGPVRISNGKAAVRRAVFQLESWSARSQEEARDLNRKVEEIEVIGRRVGDWWIQSLFVPPDVNQDKPQIPIHADDLGLFCSFTEISVFYQPA